MKWLVQIIIEIGQSVARYVIDLFIKHEETPPTIEDENTPENIRKRNADALAKWMREHPGCGD